MVVRARRVQGKGDDTVVKLRPVVPQELPDGAPPLAELRRRGRRDAGRLRLLRLVQGRAPRAARAGDHGRRAPDPQALLQGAAGVLRGARARGHRPRRPDRPRADLRAQGQVRAAGARRARSSPRCGSTPTARACSSSRRSARRTRRSRWRPRRARSSTERGIDMSGEQETKTRKALEFFAGELAAANA